MLSIWLLSSASSKGELETGELDIEESDGETADGGSSPAALSILNYKNDYSRTKKGVYKATCINPWKKNT